MFKGWHDITIRPKIQHRNVVTTAQLDWEIRELINLYDALNPTRVLEIGSQFGGTLYYWLKGADDGARVVNIDILQNMSEEDQKRLPMQWNTWAPVGVEYHCVIGRSDDPDVYTQVMKHLDGEIDFLWIDALHTYEGAKHDFEKYGQHVRRGGLIALHDIITPDFSPHIQVSKLWREIQAAGYHTQELKSGANWGGIGVVYV